MNELKIYLDKLVHFTESEMEIFVSLFSEQQLKKNEYLAIEGEHSTKLAFLTKGVMRAFYRNNEGNEYNKTFFTNFNFVGAYSSLVTGHKNLINIQCLTNCTVQITQFKKITKLYDEYPKIERLARKLAENKFAIKEKREIELVTMEASERYEIFRKEHPNLENLIPQYHIASYLGVTPTQLSRIRSKK
jgi:CRP-like cAMP-binding protein